uniref:Uncharacterized protein n=1 Tax=Glossina palpalis gambiensis TaxID=67801 RepID=A0A1B0C4P9_9MUSC
MITNFTCRHHLFCDNRSFTICTHELKRLSIIYLNTTRKLRNFIDTLMSVAGSMKMEADRSTEVITHDEHYFTYIRDIEIYWCHDPQLVLCLMPNNNA